MKQIATILGLALALAACTSGPGASAPAGGSPTPLIVEGVSTPQSIKDKGKLTCGVKFDVVGFGFR
ncbi:MAG: hypothetical protein H0V04_02905, partial [Chloroflexi bacterium]|nr:hypothetical protein [Chloroflexota bacterium]